MIKMRDLLNESEEESPIFKMGYQAFLDEKPENPLKDENFINHLRKVDRSRIDVKTFQHLMKILQQSWNKGWNKSFKDAGNKKIRKKPEPKQTTAQWLLKGHKRRKDRDNNK